MSTTQISGKITIYGWALPILTAAATPGPGSFSNAEWSHQATFPIKENLKTVDTNYNEQ